MLAACIQDINDKVVTPFAAIRQSVSTAANDSGMTFTHSSGDTETAAAQALTCLSDITNTLGQLFDDTLAFFKNGSQSFVDADKFTALIWSDTGGADGKGGFTTQGGKN
jgi:hypothetical protein